jgi:carboxypeptidase C (cathepsin A)
MNGVVSAQQPPADEPLLDTVPYGAGPDDSISDATENAAITRHSAVIGGKTVPYTARAGHLVTVDPSSALPVAKFFCVAFTADGIEPSKRAVTFLYNGGPGSSSVFLLLGSFGPRRIKTSMPDFTPPAPYSIEDNPDSLLDCTDLVFINPVGTGYSAAIAPGRNRDFWGVDEDARSIKQFIKRYLTAFDRWNSPKFLFGESYGTARSCVLGWMLHEDGIDLNGIVLQSSILDYSQTGNAIGLLPTLAADAWYHKKAAISPRPTDLPTFMGAVESFAIGSYARAKAAFPKIDPAALQTLSEMLGIPSTVLIYWGLDVSASNAVGLLFLSTLLQDKGLALGAYDGRVSGVDTGIAGSIDPNSGGNDPTMTAVGGVYTAMWNAYLNDELKFTSTSPFTDLNDQTFRFWNFGHVDPTGAQKGKDVDGNVVLYTAGDLAAAMALNPDLKVFSANGYYDSVTPFFQTQMTLDAMPLTDRRARANLVVHNYPSGHMIYLDGGSRTALKADLAQFYSGAGASLAARAQLTGSLPRCQPYFKRPPKGESGVKPLAARSEPWSVPDLCRAYDWPTGLPGGGVIAIVELDGGWTQTDMDAFFRSIGQPNAKIVDVTVDGGSNKPNRHVGEDRDPDFEVAMDIEIAAAAYFVATGRPASIRVYWTKGDIGSIASAVRAAAADGCDVCSVSWGADEALWDSARAKTGTNYAGNMEAAAATATAAGMVVFAAAGDNDARDGGPDPVNVDLPASCPSVIGCGGTTKTAQSETVWNNDPGNASGAGTGGGFSRLFPPQPWEAGAPHGPGRMVPDVAANADPDIGYRIFVHGANVAVGGTSAVAPLYAGLFAAIGMKLGFVTPKLWANQLCFNDITQGDNGFYRARIGPDACTGLGSPIGNKLADLLAVASVRAAKASAASIPEGWSGTVTLSYSRGIEVGEAKFEAGLPRKGRREAPSTSSPRSRRSQS